MAHCVIYLWKTEEAQGERREETEEELEKGSRKGTRESRRPCIIIAGCVVPQLSNSWLQLFHLWSAPLSSTNFAKTGGREGRREGGRKEEERMESRRISFRSAWHCYRVSCTSQ